MLIEADESCYCKRSMFFRLFTYCTLIEKSDRSLQVNVLISFPVRIRMCQPTIIHSKEDVNDVFFFARVSSFLSINHPIQYG